MENITIYDIGRGDAVELLNVEIAKAMADIRDPNKMAKSAREITLTLKLTPNEKRNQVSGVYQINTKLGKREPGTCDIFVAGDGDNVQSALAPINQQTLFNEAAPKTDTADAVQ